MMEERGERREMEERRRIYDGGERKGREREERRRIDDGGERREERWRRGGD